MSDKKSIGALWTHVSKKEEKYLTGSVEIDGRKVDIVVFKNKFKDQDKQPDFKIFLSEKREASGETF